MIHQNKFLLKSKFAWPFKPRSPELAVNDAFAGTLNPNLSSFLNISRWLGAFLVLTGHLRHILLVDFQQVENKTLLQKGLYFVTSLGHEAVVIFFVISGFLVGGLTLERWRARGPNIRAYAAARFSRIYIVLIPALIVGFALDSAGMHWFNASELYTNPAQYHTISLTTKVYAATDVPTFLGNLFMLQGILTGSFGSNGPLWSLAYEWWYYCLFAVIGAALSNTSKTRFVYVVVAIVIAVMLPAKLILWGTIWVLGIVAYSWVTSRAWRPHPVLGIGLLLLGLIVSRVTHNVENVDNPESLLSSFLRDFQLGICFMAALVSISLMRVRLPFARFQERLAEFSYSTYLFHFPAMLFMVAVGYQVWGLKFRLQPNVQGWTYLVVLTLVLYFYCFLLSETTERHTNVFRKKLFFYLGRTAPLPAIQQQEPWRG